MVFLRGERFRGATSGCRQAVLLATVSRLSHDAITYNELGPTTFTALSGNRCCRVNPSAVPIILSGDRLSGLPRFGDPLRLRLLHHHSATCLAPAPTLKLCCQSLSFE